MNNRLKAGIISGLIAGIVAGIVATILTPIISVKYLEPIYAFASRLYIPTIFWFAIPPMIPVVIIAIIEMMVALVWGVILGIIYMKCYSSIPGSGILKGLIYGLFVHLILGIRVAIGKYIIYATIVEAVPWIIAGFPKWITYGLVLGIIYEFMQRRYHIPKEEFKIKEYDMGSGIFPGAIAGLVGSIVVSVYNITIYNREIITAMVSPRFAKDIGFIISQFGAETLLYMILGIIFGMIFMKVYNVVPGRGFVKGIYFGLIIFLISSLQITSLHAAYGYLTYPAFWKHELWYIIKQERRWLFMLARFYFFAELFAFSVYGLVLGLLYRKPTEAPDIKKERLAKGICKHCGAKIPKKFKFCGNCGKKQ